MDHFETQKNDAVVIVSGEQFARIAAPPTPPTTLVIMDVMKEIGR
jgi:hypothetical protein